MATSFIYSIVISMLAVGVLLTKLCLSLGSYWQRKVWMRKNGCEEPPRYPNWDHIFGFDVTWRNYIGWSRDNLLPELTLRYRQFGNTYSLLMGGSRSISTIDPENIKSMLSTNFTSYNFGSRRTDAIKPFMGQSIFTLTGPAWQHSRAMIRPNLIKDQFIDAEMSTFEKHFRWLLSMLPKDGTKVDLQPLFFQFTLNTSIELLIGQDVQLEKEITDMFDNAEKLIVDEFLLSFIPFRPGRQAYIKYSQLCHDWVEKYVYEAIEDHRSQTHGTFDDKDMLLKRGKYSLLHELVKETYDAPRIRGELMGMLTAGRETTASALSSLWFTLARRPDIASKLRAEITELNGGKPTFEDLKKMKYLQNTLQEVLRLYPPLPVNMRTAIEDTILPVGGGTHGLSPILVKKGQLVLYNVFAMHRRHDIYGPDAELFIPERWEDNSLRPGWGYLPFNGGPRICLGQQFALTEIAYTTVRLLQEFQGVEAGDLSLWQEKWSLNCAVKSGCKVSLISEDFANGKVNKN